MDKTTLESLLAKNNHWLEWANIAVALGILGEIINPLILDPESRRKKLELFFNILFGFLVLTGVIGEWKYGSNVSNISSQIQRTADREVAELHKQAEEAHQVAANARREASYFERDIALANQRAAEANKRAAGAEEHLAEANVRAASAMEAAEVARKNAESFRLEIAKANEHAAEAGKEAARLKMLAEEERLARLKIEQRLADRQLTDNHIASIANRLRLFRGQEFELLPYRHLKETKAFADRIHSALNLAGWKSIEPHSSASLDGGIAGVLVDVHPQAEERTKKAANALVAALAEQGIDSELKQMDILEHPTNKLYIAVGTKQ